jgi:hypothetical protein
MCVANARTRWPVTSLPSFVLAKTVAFQRTCTGMLALRAAAPAAVSSTCVGAPRGALFHRLWRRCQRAKTRYVHVKR